MISVKFRTSANQKHWIWSWMLCDPRLRLPGHSWLQSNIEENGCMKYCMKNILQERTNKKNNYREKWYLVIFLLETLQFICNMLQYMGRYTPSPATYINCVRITWWRHQMETFSALLAICAGNSPVTGEFPAQRPVKRSFDIFFDLRLNSRLSKQ